MAFGDSLTPMSKISKEEKKSVRYSDRRYRQQSEDFPEASPILVRRGYLLPEGAEET